MGSVNPFFKSLAGFALTQLKRPRKLRQIAAGYRVGLPRMNTFQTTNPLDSVRPDR